MAGKKQNKKAKRKLKQARLPLDVAPTRQARGTLERPVPAKGKPIAPRTKVAKRKRAAMNKDIVLTRAEQAIMERMAELSPDDPRYQVLESALAFKASWVILGEHLADVMQNQRYRTWGFSSFGRYCSDELRVTQTTAKKLVRSYQWLDDEAPELVPRSSGGLLQEVTRPVPDFGTIGVLADARKELYNERVPEDAYVALKRAALEGDRTASQLRKELKEAIPEELRQQPQDPVRELRKALNASVRCLEALREWDGSDALLLQAEELRDAIVHHMPRRADGQEPAPAP